LIAIGLAACAREQAAPLVPPDVAIPSPAAELRLVAAAFSQVPGWQSDDHAAALFAFQRSCTALAKKTPAAPIGAGTRAAEWQAACRAAVSVTGPDARAFFESHFRPHLATDRCNPEGLFTGYFEAELRGARTESARYHVPIYARPTDLVAVDLGEFKQDLKGQTIFGRITYNTLAPYPTRAEIERGALKGKGLEIAWADDAVDAFFLHIQGSGRIVLDDGSVIRVGFAGRNGHDYTSIGRELIRDGEMTRDKVSMQSIRAWLAAHPERGIELMRRNASYIFFRVLDGDGPVGAQGVALTPGRSLAVDPDFVPLGAPVWLDTADPLDAARPLRRLLVAQDTGSAIKGPVRGDLFWGYGRAAAERAGRMNVRGRYYILLPVPPRR
jgi:membrane-bound lytic murein transglycosylase A